MKMILVTAASTAILFSTGAFAQKADGTTLAGGDNGAKAKATESGKSASTGMTKGATPMKSGSSTSNQGTPGPTNPKPGQ